MQKYKRFVAGFFILVLFCLLTGCASIGEGDKIAVIQLPDGRVVQGIVDSWCQMSDGMIEITINGITYTTHSLNVSISWNANPTE